MTLPPSPVHLQQRIQKLEAALKDILSLLNNPVMDRRNVQRINNAWQIALSQHSRSTSNE